MADIQTQGLIKILGYETRHNVTAGGSLYSDTTHVTRLKLHPNQGPSLDIEFNSHVGFELNDAYAIYIENNEEISSNVQGRTAKQVTKTQELIPVDKGTFPPYKAIDCNYQG